MSTWKHSGSGRLAASEEVISAASPVIPCQSSASGHQVGCSKYTRGQSRDTDSLSRLSGSVEASAKFVSMGPGHCRKRLQNSVRFSSASVQRGHFHSGGSRAGSGYGTGSKHSPEEGSHRTCTSPRQRVRVLQPVLHCSQEGWVLHPILDLRQLNRAFIRLKFRKLTLKQVVSQIRWFVTINLKDAYFHVSIFPQHRKLLMFGGVLEALCNPPFEELSDRFLTIFLLDISSLKRVGDLQALSVVPSYLEFAPGMAKAFLYPRPGYVHKVPSSVPQPVVLQAFCPPPFRDPDQQKLNFMWSV